jgi:hypothetical protein
MTVYQEGKRPGHDNFAVVSADAAPAWFSVFDLATNCYVLGNTSLSRALPVVWQCYANGADYQMCIGGLNAYLHRLRFARIESLTGPLHNRTGRFVYSLLRMCSVGYNSRVAAGNIRCARSASAPSADSTGFNILEWFNSKNESYGL